MMRVRRLDLTRFGHFTDRSVDLGPAVPGGSDFHIIYGPNEAGKTTLMEAYLRLIYGFPMRDSYGFKHPLNMLQVGGLLEINQVGTELVRVKRSANSLLDQHGDAISETVLQACLGGIGQDDYRKLFCLDDATIEAGGEEITNSKGDIGRLLFAAAAGIGDLTGVLDQVAARAEAFYKRSASKTTFAGLRRDLDAVTGEIKAQDVSASLYHSLRLSLETAKTAEAAARAAKEAMERRKSQLAALIAAHPISVELRAAEVALDPLSHYPTTLDIDPEALVALMTARVALEMTRDSQSEAIAKAQASRADLVLRPEIIALRDDVAGLDELRGRMEGAFADLPIRTDERAAALAELSAKLVEMGFEPGADPTRFVLPEHHLRRLERSLETLRDAETLRGGAIREERAAQIAHKESAAQLAEAEAAVTVGPEVGDVLVRFGAAQCVDANRAALGRLELARATAAQKLRDLARGDTVFTTLPLVPLTERQANTLATDILKVDQQIETLRTARATAEEKVAKAIARLGVLSAAADLVTDELAQAHRTERNARWTKHRATLDGSSADLFADAMQQDDRATALRQAQTREIAEYHQARITASEAEAEQKLANTRLQDEIAARRELDAARARHLAAIELPTDMTGADLADWLGQHVTARSALDEVQAVQDATATARRLAEDLRQALSALPGLPEGEDLATLFRIAQEQTDTRKSQLANLQSKREAHAKDVTALAALQAALRDARADCDTAADLWQTEASTALPADTPIGNLRDVLPSLRSLREINETIIGLTRQITGMSRDRDAFVARIAPIAQVVGAPADQEPLARYRTIRTALSEAEAAYAAWEKLTETIENAETARSSAITALTTAVLRGSDLE
jgi:uncharacterized protein YhaN